MSRFNTGNPLGSGSPLDLDDNAKNMDLAMNSDDPTWVDRFGRFRMPVMEQERQFLAGQVDREQRFNEFILSSGYLFVGDYGPGIELTEYNQVVRDENGEFWRVSGITDLPYVTTGTGAPEDGALVSVGDAALRQSLADLNDGASLVGYTKPTIPLLSSYADNSVGAAIADLNAQFAEDGIFVTPDELGFRFGKIAYKNKHGAASLYSSLDRFFPDGASIRPDEKEQFVWQRTTLPPKRSSSDPLSYDYQAEVDGWKGYMGIGAGLYAVDPATGKVYQHAPPGTALPDTVRVFRQGGAGNFVIRIQMSEPLDPDTFEWYSRVYPTGVDESAIYVDPVNGNDLRSGLSFYEAKATIPAAIARSPKAVFLRPGVYRTAANMGFYTGAADLSIQCVGGKAIMVGSPFSYSWGLDGATGLYKAVLSTSSAAVGVLDINDRDEYGDPIILARQVSLSALQASDYGCWFDGATREMWIKRRIPEAPDYDSVIPYRVEVLGVEAADVKVHLADIEFVGGSAGCFRARSGSISTVVIGERCGVFGSYNADGWQIKDIGLSITIDCYGSQCANDIFNYHALNGITPHFIEIRNRGTRGMAVGTGNGSTAHEDVVGIRIDCDYRECRGPGVADVDDSRSYNINITSRRNGPHSNAAGVQSAGNAVIWLDGVSTDSNAGGGIAVLSNATAYVRRANVRDAVVVADNGSILAF